LTDVGLAIINPDTFVGNKKLRMLTISGNDLSVMSSIHYLLKVSDFKNLYLEIQLINYNFAVFQH